MKILAQAQAGGALFLSPPPEHHDLALERCRLRRPTPRRLSSPGCAIKPALLVLALILPFPVSAQLAADAAPSAVLVDAGPHQRTWQTVRQIDTGQGLVAET